MSQGSVARLLFARNAYLESTEHDKRVLVDSLMRTEQIAKQHIDINACRDAFWANYVRTGNYGRPLQCVAGPYQANGADIPRNQRYEHDIRCAEERPNLSICLKDFDVVEKNYGDVMYSTEPDTYFLVLRARQLFE